MAELVVMQTASGPLYEKMLSATSVVNQAFCRPRGYHYRCHVGVKRGYYHWQATFNRVPMLAELMREGYRGWVLFLDADAFVRNATFDLNAYVQSLDPHIAMVAEPGGNLAKWDINAGVFLINLGADQGRQIVEIWQALEGIHAPDRHLKSVVEPWGRLPTGDTLLNDQALLHLVFQIQPALENNLHTERGLFNYGDGSFVSQHIRRKGEPDADRLSRIQRDCLDVLERFDLLPAPDLTHLANVAGTDKGSKVGNAHSYTRLYAFLLEQFRLDTFDALELGLLRGGPEVVGGQIEREAASPPSINMWLDYFPFARLFGIDISDFSRFQTDRFRFFRADLSDLAAVRAVRRALPKLRFVVDDASHASYHQQVGFCAFFPLLEPGGFYIIEDCNWQPGHLEPALPKVKLTRNLFMEFSRTGRLDLDDDLVRQFSASGVSDQISDVFFHRSEADGGRGSVVKLIALRKK